MKRILCMMVLLLCLGCFAPVSAQDTSTDGQGETGQDYAAQYSEILQSSGAQELMEDVPDKTQELLEEYGISSLDPQNILSLKPADLLSLLWKLLVEQLRSPFRTISCVLAVVVLCALLENMQGAFAKSTMKGVFSVVSTLCIAGIVVMPVTKCIIECAEVVHSISNFMLCFIPVMTTVMTASGQPVTAGTYNLFLFGACEVIAKIAASTLVPMLCMYLALCLVGSVTTNMKIAPVSSSLKSILSWALGFLITLFVGMLSLQSLVSVSADTVTMKATKFVVSNLVPVVGGALSDALGSVQACMKVIKSTVGAFGIITALFTFLPSLIKIVLWLGAVKLGAVFAGMLGVEKAGKLLDSVSSALSLLFAMLLCFGLFLTVTTTFMMVLGSSV